MSSHNFSQKNEWTSILMSWKYLKPKFKFHVFPSRQDRKTNSSNRFLGEVTTRQFCFKIYWPLKSLNFKWVKLFKNQFCNLKLNSSHDFLQVNLLQKHLFLRHLTHNCNMTTDCSLNYKFSTKKLQNMSRTLIFCFCYDIQKQFSVLNS